MKKSVVFLVLPIIGLIFFACQFNLPTAIEITGSPSVRFTGKVDIGKMFTDLLVDAFESSDEMDIFPCPQTEDITYLIHMDLFNEEFEGIQDTNDIDDLQDIFPDLELISADFNTALTEDRTLINTADDPMILPLSDIGNLLKDFKFSGQITQLYFSGSSLISKAKIDITIYEVDGATKNRIGGQNGVSLGNTPSAIGTWKADGEYKGTASPTGGVEIGIPLTGKDIAISFKGYIPQGTTLTLNDIKDDGNINVEAVLWLPFAFQASEDGAEIEFPDDALFSSETDLFGREEAGAENMMTDAIESLSLEIVFDSNPFQGSKLIVSSKNIEIENSLTNNSLPFVISEENMRKINAPENFPFTPHFKMRFSSGAVLHFPRRFNAVEFIFKAKIKYKMDL